MLKKSRFLNSAIAVMLLLLCPLGASAEIAVSQVKLVRGLDGRWIPCNRPHHLNRSTWAIQNIEVEISENSLVHLKAQAQFSQCKENPEKAGQVQWIPGNPLAKFSKTNPNGETYTMWHENLSLIFINLDNDEISQLKAKPEADLEIDQTFRLGQLLMPSEIEKLTAGEAVSTSLGIYPQSSASVEKAGKDIKTYEPESWGRFQIQFLLQKK